MHLAELSPDDFAEWNTFADSAPAGGVYSRTDYLTVLASQDSAEVKVIAVEEDGRILGGLPLFIRARNGRNYVRGRYLLYYNGPVVSGFEDCARSTRQKRTFQVLSEIEHYLSASEFDPIEIKARSPLADYRAFLAKGWRVSPVHSLTVDVSDLELLFRNMHRNARRQIRQAESRGIVAWRSNDAELFCKMHRATCRRRGFPSYLDAERMIAFVRGVQDKGLGFLMFAGEDRDSPSSVLLVLQSCHPTAHIVCAGSLTESPGPGVSAFIRWSAFRSLSQDGIEQVDLTDAHNSSVANFKNQFGAELVTSHRVERAMTAVDHCGRAAELTLAMARRSLKRLLSRNRAR